jgi:glutathione S-transferase
VAEDGGFDLGRYPAVTDWIARIASTPGYLPMDS